jgi:hypothetical protein
MPRHNVTEERVLSVTKSNNKVLIEIGGDSWSRTNLCSLMRGVHIPLCHITIGGCLCTIFPFGYGKLRCEVTSSRLSL